MSSLSRESIEAIIQEGFAEAEAGRRHRAKAPTCFHSLNPSSLKNAVKTQKPLTAPARQSPEERWPHLIEKSGVHSGLTWPLRDMRKALNWTWLQWHATQDYSIIKKVLRQETICASRLYGLDGISQALRGGFDYFLLQLAFLSGDADLFQTVAPNITIGIPRSAYYQFEPAWCGVVSALLSNDTDTAKRQLGLFAKFKPTRMWAWPSLRLTRHLVEEDWRAFSQVLVTELQACHSWGTQTQAFDVLGRLLPDKLDSHFTWPHPTMVMVVIASMRGWSYEPDSVWLPKGLHESVLKSWNG